MELEDRLSHPEAELAALQSELQARLSGEIATVVDDFVAAHADAWLHGILFDSGERQTLLQRLAEPPEEGEDKPAFQVRARRFFELADPRLIGQDLKKVERLDGLDIVYAALLDGLVAHPTAGILVKRYRLPPTTVRSLWMQCLTPLRDAGATLRPLLEALQAHQQTVSDIQNSKGMATGLSVAASLVGGMVGGRLGSQGARMLVGAALDPRSRLNASMAQVLAGYEGTYAGLYELAERVRERGRVVLASLVGGMLLRLEADLQALGKTIAWVNLQAATLGVELAAGPRASFESWAQAEMAAVKQLEANGDIAASVARANTALAKCVAEPACYAIGPDEKTSWGVLFARCRATGLNQLGHAAWDRGDLKAAGEAYTALLTETPVLGYVAQPDSDGEDPADIAVAGWRLALLARAGDDAAATLPRVVRAGLVRFAADPAWALSGEAVSPHALKAAHAIARFCDAQAIDTRPDTFLPEPLRGRANALWDEIEAEPHAVWDAVGRFGGLPAGHSEDAPFATWVASESRAEKIGAGILVGGAGLGCLSLLLLVTLVAYWYLAPTWGMPTTPAGFRQAWVEDPNQAAAWYEGGDDEVREALARGAVAAASEASVSWLEAQMEAGTLESRAMVFDRDSQDLLRGLASNAEGARLAAVELYRCCGEVAGHQVPEAVEQLSEVERRYAVPADEVLAGLPLEHSVVHACETKSESPPSISPLEPGCLHVSVREPNAWRLEWVVRQEGLGRTHVAYDGDVQGRRRRAAIRALDALDDVVRSSLALEMDPATAVADWPEGVQSADCAHEAAWLAVARTPASWGILLKATGRLDQVCSGVAASELLKAGMPAWILAAEARGSVASQIRAGGDVPWSELRAGVDRLPNEVAEPVGAFLEAQHSSSIGHFGGAVAWLSKILAWFTRPIGLAVLPAGGILLALFYFANNREAAEQASGCGFALMGLIVLGFGLLCCGGALQV